MFRYYSTQRPVAPGTFPGRPVRIENFDTRENVPGIGPAWGFLEYTEALSEAQVEDYELKKEEG